MVTTTYSDIRRTGPLPSIVLSIKKMLWKTYRTFRASPGFTLVELLVVIGIISILATVLLLQLGTARAKARDAKRIADVNQVRSAVELYFDDNGAYPANGADLSVLAPKYLVKIPVDPLATGCTSTYNGSGSGPAFCYGYAYQPTSNPVRYQIWAELEESNRSALNSDGDLDPTNDWGGTIGGFPHSGKGPVGSNAEACSSSTTIDCVFDLGQN